MAALVDSAANTWEKKKCERLYSVRTFSLLFAQVLFSISIILQEGVLCQGVFALVITQNLEKISERLGSDNCPTHLQAAARNPQQKGA
jgi:hypothetical protein